MGKASSLNTLDGKHGRDKLQLSVKCKYHAKNSGGLEVSERTSSKRRYFSAYRYECYIAHVIGVKANMKNVRPTRKKIYAKP
jgi:hypothetical protein